MANAASKSSVTADMRPPDFRAAVKRMSVIPGKLQKQQAIAKEIQDVYAACEATHGVDKTAAKMFRALSKLDTNDRLRTFRHLNGLLDAAGWESEAADLVDKAENNVVAMRMGRPAEDDDEISEDIGQEVDEITGDETPGDGDDFEEASEEEIAAQAPRAAKKKTAKADKDEPFTGDNSDLADAGEE